MTEISKVGWVHNLDPFFVKFPDGWFIEGIRWYGVAYLLSFLLAVFFLKHLFTKKVIRLDESAQQRFIFALFCGVLLGGRLGYAFFYAFNYYTQNPVEILQIWKGGMSFHGALIGIFFSFYIFGKKEHYKLLSLTDLTVPLGTLGIFLGRCANFINGEVYGRFTNVPWGVYFNHELLARHPSQLYEAFGEGLLLFFVSYFLVKKRSVTQNSGYLTSVFLILYSFIRFLLEYVREPDAPLIGPLTRGQFYSIFMCLAGILCFYYAKTDAKTKSQFNSVFCD